MTLNIESNNELVLNMKNNLNKISKLIQIQQNLINLNELLAQKHNYFIKSIDAKQYIERKYENLDFIKKSKILVFDSNEYKSISTLKVSQNNNKYSCVWTHST
jgi:hypothetical protein